MSNKEIIQRFPALAEHQSLIVPAPEAVGLIQPGHQVYLGSACATPRLLAEALENLDSPPPDVTLLHFFNHGAIPHRGDEAHTRYRHKCFFVGADERDAVSKWQAEYIPVSLSQVPGLVENGRIPIDVALVQVSPPDEFGYASLGVSVDVTISMVQHARHVIAEINPNMPRTMGDSLVHVSRFDAMVWNDTPVIEPPVLPSDEIVEQIARNIAGIIEDRCTLQIGLGRLPQESLKYLMDRRDLGIHSDLITDAIVPLVEKGVINGQKKGQYKGMVVASYCMGTRKLYDLIDRNPFFSIQAIERVSEIHAISQQHKMVSVTQACSVDLTGQICSDQFEGQFCGGVSTQPEFIRGAAQSPGGKPIICLQSATLDGKTSRIRPLLQGGEGVTIARSDVHYVITEYGIAYLFGKSIRERALALIQIAHPDFRPWLLDEAKKLGYVGPEQSMKNPDEYPEDEERRITLRNQKSVLIRPTRKSDAPALQQFFRRMIKEDRYTRMFWRLNQLSDNEAQRLCNADQDSDVAFLVVSGSGENETLIGSACYFVNASTNMAEVAYMVTPEWQGVGIGKALQLRLMEHAKARGLRGFSAEIQTYNANMINLAKQACDSITIARQGDTHEVTMLFE
ncbi:MAG: GNAT family N-acetyltransferase [Sulfurimicrobium sp.]|nr:GNAT family N-acetyltransferase [Sulfurimicrobium sp.]MDP2198039.1 GNAT family N-acetyltransferase [Sulfurimicrobium sp.]MDP3688623.1 GNAT family N-acetyltransferase [Sulfurimicrobium sp.]